MEGHGNQTYIHEDLNYDDLINTNWPATTAESQYNYQQSVQDQYNNFTSNPSPYDNFDMSQPSSYPNIPFSNSPYVSQYQSTRPSDAFNPSSFGGDPSLSGSVYSSQENTFSFNPQALETAATISPQNLQFNVLPNQVMNRVTAPSAYQQRPANTIAAYSQRPQIAPATHSQLYYNTAQTSNNQTNQSNEIRYANIPVTSTGFNNVSTVTSTYIQETKSPAPRPLQLNAAAPQDILRVTRPDLLSNHRSTRPPLIDAPFISWEDQAIEITLGLKSTLPKYQPRQSRSGKQIVPGLDTSRALNSGSNSSTRVRPPKETKILVSKYKGTSKAARPLADKVQRLREDGTIAASPATSTEASSSEYDSTSEEEEEEEEYEEMEEVKKTDISDIRGPNRPETDSEAARWDAIGIIWKDPASSQNGDTVKEAIEKYGNFVSALRVKLKTNSTELEVAVSRSAEAEAKALRQERKVLLDSFQQTIEAANVHGHPAIVENLGGHHKLVNGLTTTLIECVKVDDFNGPLPKSVLTLLAKFQTMTDELLKRLKFDSIQKRWNKKGDDETKKLISEINANTIDARERTSKSKKDLDRVEEEKNTKDKVEAPKARNPQASTSSAPTSAKRQHDGELTNGKPAKKFASDVGGTPASVSKVLPPRKPPGNLLGIASKPVPKTIPKKRDISPPTESKLGALLASIEKPPEPKKAPDTPQRAPETPEEQARRERKENRRHLRVKFKEGPDLEEIRLFKHEQVEDEGRQDEMLRDAHDDRSEGMMHKKRVLEIVDDEEEYQPMLYESPLPELKPIDFAALQKQTRFGLTYISRGGDLQISTPEQRTQKRREEVELVAIYIDSSDIPPSAKEPSQMEDSRDVQERELKLPNEPWFLQRLQTVQYLGADHATELLLHQRQQQRGSQHQTTISPFPTVVNTSPISQPSAHSSSYQQPPSVDPAAVDALFENLNRVVAIIKGKRYPPEEPNEWMVNEPKNESHVQGWWDGYYRDKAEKERLEAERRHALDMQNTQAFQPVPPVQAIQHHHQISAPIAPQFSMPIPPSIQTANTQPAPDLVSRQVQNILASYQTSDATTAPPVQAFDYSSWAAMQQQYNSQNDYKEQEYSGWNENSNTNTGSNKGKRGGKPANESPLFDENGEYKGKKKPCRFYRDGKCVKGDKCTYLHEE